MIVDSIERGIVIDHITAGTGHRIIEALNIDTKAHTVAFIMNATSEKHGHKDLIKIVDVTDVDLTVLGLLDPNATVNVIENGQMTPNKCCVTCGVCTKIMRQPTGRPGCPVRDTEWYQPEFKRVLGGK